MANQKNNRKEDVRGLLLETGRKLVAEKGPEFLTARKLSEASGCSVGTIYNQFANMDNFIIEQNMQTMEELSGALNQILPEDNFYQNLNRCVDAYVEWIINHKNLWMLFYDFHLHSKAGIFPAAYCRQLLKLTRLGEKDFERAFGRLKAKERKLSRQVMLLSLFSLSSFLLGQSTGKVSKRNLCKLLMNTYLAGLEVLKRVK